MPAASWFWKTKAFLFWWNQSSSCADLIRASISLKRMDCRVKFTFGPRFARIRVPGNDAMNRFRQKSLIRLDPAFLPTFLDDTRGAAPPFPPPAL
jgi:hypothetical protein